MLESSMKILERLNSLKEKMISTIKDLEELNISISKITNEEDVKS